MSLLQEEGRSAGVNVARDEPPRPDLSDELVERLHVEIRAGDLARREALDHTLAVRLWRREHDAVERRTDGACYQRGMRFVVGLWLVTMCCLGCDSDPSRCDRGETQAPPSDTGERGESSSEHATLAAPVGLPAHIGDVANGGSTDHERDGDSDVVTEVASSTSETTSLARTDTGGSSVEVVPVEEPSPLADANRFGHFNSNGEWIRAGQSTPDCWAEW